MRDGPANADPCRYRLLGTDPGRPVGSAAACAAGGDAAPRCARLAMESGKKPSTTINTADATITNRVRPPEAVIGTAFAGRGFMYITRTTWR